MADHDQRPLWERTRAAFTRGVFHVWKPSPRWFVVRGLPDAPMHHVILWGATTSSRPTAKEIPRRNAGPVRTPAPTKPPHRWAQGPMSPSAPTFVILSGAKNPSPVLLYRGRNTDSSPAAQNDEGRVAQNDEGRVAQNDGGGAHLCVRPPPQTFPQGKASGTVPIHGLFAARGQGRARG